MKKLLFISLAILSANAMAWEFNAKGGYDFIRSENFKIGQEKDAVKLENGWVVGAEFIPLNKNKVELGIGTEYNFGKNKLYFTGEDLVERKFIPVYALGKLNLVTSEDNTSSLYLFGRLGAAYKASDVKIVENENESFGNFISIIDDSKPAASNGNNGGAPAEEKPLPKIETVSKEETNTSSTVEKGLALYYGLGLGFDYKNFLVEALYDGSYSSKKMEVVENETSKLKTFNNKFGLRVGFRFGDYKKAAPVVVEEPVFVPIPEVKAPVVVAPVVVESKGRLIHASCSEVEKKCVIHGFKVDGREPNAEEKANIAEIAQLVNGFAVSGEATLIGHTDSTGSDAYNQKLSVARAQSVNKLLRESGLKEEIHIHEVTGKGEKEPMATNKTKQGRYLNRRVEILFDELNVR